MWFDRTEILLGEEGIVRLRQATVMVVGLGGVGAVAAEMIARAGVGHMIILDSDVVSETNKNRQTIAFDSTIGALKTEVVARKILDINPEINLEVKNVYLDVNNVAEVVPSSGIDFLVDAIDTLSPKLALINYCVQNSIKLVSSMGSGAKYDITRIRIADLSKSFNCPLAYMVRKKLRKMGISKGFPVVFSEELPDEAAIVPMTLQEQAEVSNKKSQVGTISYLPVAFGCACAQVALLTVCGKR